MRVSRGKAKIKVRQPLQEAVVVADRHEREAIERLVDVVREELNVEDVLSARKRDLPICGIAGIDATNAAPVERPAIANANAANPAPYEAVRVSLGKSKIWAVNPTALA